MKYLVDILFNRRIYFGRALVIKKQDVFLYREASVFCEDNISRPNREESEILAGFIER